MGWKNGGDGSKHKVFMGSRCFLCIFSYFLVVFKGFLESWRTTCGTPARSARSLCFLSSQGDDANLCSACLSLVDLKPPAKTEILNISKVRKVKTKKQSRNIFT